MIFYKIILSGKNNEIKIDAEELPMIMEAIGKGGLVACKQGIFNPSYVISITEDVDRWVAWNESPQREAHLQLENRFPKSLVSGELKKLT